MSIASANRRRFHPVKHFLQMTCDWAVYRGKSGASLCYCTDVKRARLISRALNYYLKHGGRIE